MPFTYHTKHVNPDDDILIQSKQCCSIEHLLSCVDCYYVDINFKHNGMCNLKKILTMGTFTHKCLFRWSHIPTSGIDDKHSSPVDAWYVAGMEPFVCVPLTCGECDTNQLNHWFLFISQLRLVIGTTLLAPCTMHNYWHTSNTLVTGTWLKQPKTEECHQLCEPKTHDAATNTACF